MAPFTAGWTLLAFALVTQAEAPGNGASVSELLAAADAAYDARHEAGKLEEVERKLTAAQEIAPNDYDVLWRLARLYFWRSDDPALPNDEKSHLGKLSWDHADKAVAQKPGGVEGHYYAAVGMGNYSIGIGVLKALTQGIEGKFKKRLGEAERLVPKYEDGAIYTAWGRFWYELPWPKYDEEKSQAALRRALELGPNNLRARLYLADLYLKEDAPGEAKKLVDAILAAKLGQYDLAEEQRVQEMTRGRLAAIAEALQ